MLRVSPLPAALRALLVALSCGLISAAAPDGKQRAAKEIKSARALAAVCDYKAAAREAETALESTQRFYGDVAPEAGYVLYDLTDYLLLSGQLDEALTRAQESFKQLKGSRGESSLEASLAGARLAKIFIEGGRIDKAQQTLAGVWGGIRVHAPAAPRAAFEGYEVAWRLALLQQRYDDAVSLSRDMMTLVAKSDNGLQSRAARHLSESFLVRGDWKDAEIALGDAKRLAGDSKADATRVTLLRAELALARTEYSATISLLNEAKRSAESPDACANSLLGLINKKQGDVHYLRRDGLAAAASYASAQNAFMEAGLADGSRDASILYGLAGAKGLIGQYEDSDKLYQQAEKWYRSVYGPASVQVAQVHIDHALMLADKGDSEGALKNARSSIAVLDQSKEPLISANAQSALAAALLISGDKTAARNAYNKTIVQFQDVGGPNSADLVPALAALAQIELDTGAPARAEQFLERAIKLQRASGWKSARGLGNSLSLLAQTQLQRGDLAKADAASLEAVALVRAQTEMGATSISTDAIAQQRLSRKILERDAEIALARLPDKNARLITDKAIVERVFADAQLAVASRTGLSVAQTAARLAKQDSKLGHFLRERQTLIEKHQVTDEQLVGGLTQRELMTSEARNELRNRSADLRAKIAQADADIKRVDPNYFLNVSGAPLNIAETQALMKPGESVIVFFLGERQSLTIIVSQLDAVIVRSAVDGPAIDKMLQKIRGMLDKNLMPGGGGVARFQPDEALAVYRELLLPAETILSKASTLIVVPDGGFQYVPISVLLTSPAPAEQNLERPSYANWPWLIKRSAILTAPSLLSVAALRQKAKPSVAPLPFLGIGDPLLGGGAPAQTRAGDDVARYWSNGRADPDALRTMRRLNTSGELSDMVTMFKATSSALLVQDNAREKALRARLDLHQYRILAFATHGLTAGDPALFQPGLVMTPPATASDDDDGLLTSGEIADLNLNADWVLLFACSTAAEGQKDPERLSGLARSFFIAGARGVLVSNWDVDSAATSIFSRKLAEGAAKGLTRGNAVQEAQLYLLNSSFTNHPYYWAPFSTIAAE